MDIKSFVDCCINVELGINNDSYTLTLRLSEDPKPKDFRLRMAIVRLCEYDAVIVPLLKSGKTVRKTIPFKPSDIDGPHSANELVLPLLLPLKISNSLYSYQQSGVDWLIQRDRALLGDDMGLGKSAQAIVAARKLIRNATINWVLIIVPRTLISNWQVELRKWAPELTIATALFQENERVPKWNRIVRSTHFLITSYEQIRKPIEGLKKNPPDLIIADEAHRLRNIDSLTTKGFRSIVSKRIWALTGTPMERDPKDFAVLLSTINPFRFSVKDYLLPLTTFRARSRPYILRRKKDEVLTDLPGVIEETELLDLNEIQQKKYNDAITSFTSSSLNKGYLALFNQLRTICDIESLSKSSSKIDRCMEIIDDIRSYAEKVVVFSYILEPLYELQRRLEGTRYEIVTGKMELQERNLALEKFRHNSNCSVLLASTRITSEGLNLTEANHIIFINRWWNPSSNLQARDRVVRIGQKNLVTIRSFSCRNTVEQRLETLLSEKTFTFNQLINDLGRSDKRTEVLNLIRSDTNNV